MQRMVLETDFQEQLAWLEPAILQHNGRKLHLAVLSYLLSNTTENSIATPDDVFIIRYVVEVHETSNRAVPGIFLVLLYGLSNPGDASVR